MCDLLNSIVDISSFNVTCMAKSLGILYAGHPAIDAVYKLFNGFDDNGAIMDNYWISKNETYNNERLKKYRKQRVRGRIQTGQTVGVYIENDSGGFNKVGTIRGDVDTVDTEVSGVIGSEPVGENMVGGMSSESTTDFNSYTFFFELKVRTGKFRNRAIKFVTGKQIGRASCRERV